MPHYRAVILVLASNNNPVYISNTASSNPYGAYIYFPNASPNDGTRYFLSCVSTPIFVSYIIVGKILCIFTVIDLFCFF